MHPSVKKTNDKPPGQFSTYWRLWYTAQQQFSLFPEMNITLKQLVFLKRLKTQSVHVLFQCKFEQGLSIHGKILKQAYSTATALSNFHMKLQNKRQQWTYKEPKGHITCCTRMHMKEDWLGRDLITCSFKLVSLSLCFTTYTHQCYSKALCCI